MNARSHTNRELLAAIKQAEGRLSEGRRLQDTALETLRDLARAADASGALTPSLSRRVSRIESTHALRARAVPGPVLEGLYDDIARATEASGVCRARVTNTWLEAPRSLAVWRRTAAAACVLALVSVGWMLSTDRDTAPARKMSQVERYALLDGVLERHDGSAAPAGGEASNVEMVGHAPIPRRPSSGLGTGFAIRQGPMQIFTSSPSQVRFFVKFRAFPEAQGEVEHN